MNILFILAHPDDEAFGPAGTIIHLAKTNKVTVISLCNGARPGNEAVAADREAAFIQSCTAMGAMWKIYERPDCSLTYDATLKSVETLIDHYKPDAVYTHNISDIHRDHRLVAECCVVACRPKPESTVMELYMTEITASTDWSFGQIEPVFKPNVYVDITNYIEIKEMLLSLYQTELYKFPDARSVESMRTTAMFRGKQAGFEYAEAFSLVFKRI